MTSVGSSEEVFRNCLFLLWRQDDNGNRFLVAAYITKIEADERLKELSRHTHRQIYWIEVVDHDDSGQQ